MSEGSVIFKGSLNGLTIIMKEEEDYDSILFVIYNVLKKLLPERFSAVLS